MKHELGSHHIRNITELRSSSPHHRELIYLFCLLISSYSNFTLSFLYFILIVFVIIFIYYIPRVCKQNTKKTKHCRCDQLSPIKNFLISLPRQTQKFQKEAIKKLGVFFCSGLDLADVWLLHGVCERSMNVYA